MKINPGFKPQAGFTLIEILIVMVIIGILATLGIGSFQSSQQKSRDARRKSDLKQIGVALEAYYNDYGQYPVSSAGNLIVGCAGGSACNWGETFTDDNGTMYMVELPTDPRATLNYVYVSSGAEYQLYSRLENTLDQSVPKDAQDAAQVYQGLDCGSDNCNYGIASSNTTPATGQTLVAD